MLLKLFPFKELSRFLLLACLLLLTAQPSLGAVDCGTKDTFVSAYLTFVNKLDVPVTFLNGSNFNCNDWTGEGNPGNFADLAIPAGQEASIGPLEWAVNGDSFTTPQWQVSFEIGSNEEPITIVLVARRLKEFGESRAALSHFDSQKGKYSSGPTPVQGAGRPAYITTSGSTVENGSVKWFLDFTPDAIVIEVPPNLGGNKAGCQDLRVTIPVTFTDGFLIDPVTPTHTADSSDRVNIELGAGGPSPDNTFIGFRDNLSEVFTYPDSDSMIVTACAGVDCGNKEASKIHLTFVNQLDVPLVLMKNMHYDCEDWSGRSNPGNVGGLAIPAGQEASVGPLEWAYATGQDGELDLNAHTLPKWQSVFQIGSDEIKVSLKGRADGGNLYLEHLNSAGVLTTGPTPIAIPSLAGSSQTVSVVTSGSNSDKDLATWYLYFRPTNSAASSFDESLAPMPTAAGPSSSSGGHTAASVIASTIFLLTSPFFFQ